MHRMGSLGDQELLGATLHVPEHVVYRRFAAEMVMLNLNTGRYHGLNPTAGKMLLALDATTTVSDAVDALAGEYELDRSDIETDVMDLSRDLLERGLLQAGAGG